MEVGIYYRQLFYFMVLQYFCCFFQVGALCGGYKIVRGHYFVDRALQVTLETQVAVCDNAFEHAVVIDYRDAAYVVFAHHVQRVLHGSTAADGHRIIYHAVFGTFHGMHLASLLLYGHVFVYYTDSAFARYGYG